jgi:hypothetical protein
MAKILASKLDIEDYYGMAMDTIEFESPVELDTDEFDVRVDDFSYAGCDDCDDEEGATIRLQFEHEDSNGEEEDIDQATRQITDIILDYAEGTLNENTLYEEIYSALELVM